MRCEISGMALVSSLKRMPLGFLSRLVKIKSSHFPTIRERMLRTGHSGNTGSMICILVVVVIFSPFFEVAGCRQSIFCKDSEYSWEQQRRRFEKREAAADFFGSRLLGVFQPLEDGQSRRFRATISPTLCRDFAEVVRLFAVGVWIAYHFTSSCRILPSLASSGVKLLPRYCTQSITSFSVPLLRTVRLPSGETRITVPSFTGMFWPST